MTNPCQSPARQRGQGCGGQGPWSGRLWSSTGESAHQRPPGHPCCTSTATPTACRKIYKVLMRLKFSQGPLLSWALSCPPPPSGFLPPLEWPRSDQPSTSPCPHHGPPSSGPQDELRRHTPGGCSTIETHTHVHIHTCTLTHTTRHAARSEPAGQGARLPDRCRRALAAIAALVIPPLIRALPAYLSV